MTRFHVDFTIVFIMDWYYDQLKVSLKTKTLFGTLEKNSLFGTQTAITNNCILGILIYSVISIHLEYLVEIKSYDH